MAKITSISVFATTSLNERPNNIGNNQCLTVACFLDLVPLSSTSKNEMGGACSTYREKRGAHRILVVDLREGDHLGDPGVDARIILK
jgi:hypothetical protein